MKNKKLKSIFSFILASFLFFSQIKTVQAINVGNVNKVMGINTPPALLNSIFNDLGIDKNEIKSNIQTLNVARLKKTPPSVSLFFSPNNPSEGEKVTVAASPTYFLNDPKELYYTWFLKTAKCTDKKTDGDDYKYNSDCDLNNDGNVDIFDYKIKAARIIANGGFIISSDDIYKTSSDNDGYEASFGGNDQKGKNGHCFIHDTESGEEYEIDCGSGKDSHLFPHAEYENFIDHKGNEMDLDEETGNGDFGRDEEKFWHTDPNSNDTANLGKPDEANITGLNITNFTWNYQKGDKIGVVVEGVSTDPSPSDDSAYKTMWAMNEGVYEIDADLKNNTYPKTIEEIISTTDNGDGTTTIIIEENVQEIEGGENSIVNGIATIKNTATMHSVIINNATQEEISDTIIAETDEVSNPIITYFTEDFSDNFEINDSDIEKPSDLNNFLYNSLVSPQENTAGSDKLDINLSFFPNNPMNDPSGVNGSGDIITIHSSISNAKDENYLQYEWKIYAGTDIDSDMWGDPILKKDLFESTQSSGLGINTFKFKLGFPKTIKYLKAVLTVTENTGEKNPRKNIQDIIIPINSTTEEIKVSDISLLDLSSTPNIDKDNLSRIKIAQGNEICNSNDLEKAICSVAKNQIVGLSVPKENFPITDNPDFLWTIDGNPFSYPYCFFEDCNPEKQTFVAYFPVLKDPGEQYTVNLTATNKNGEKINLTRTFKVVDPKITIVSDDKNNCNQVILGNYFDVKGGKFYDYSELNFWANNDSSIKLKAVTNGFSVLPENLSWEVDNDQINQYNAGNFGFNISSNGILTLPPKEKHGESYSVSVGTLYTQNKLIKKLLYTVWGVSYNQFYEKIISDDAIITMQEAEAKTTKAKSKKIFATIYSSTPEYLAFLIRIFLTISLILFITKLIFSFYPQINKQAN